MSFQTSALILSWVAILLLGLVVSGLVRQVHALSTGANRPIGGVGPRPGSQAPDLTRLAPGHHGTLVLLFLEPDCHTCAEVLDEAGRQSVPAVHAVYRGAAPPGAPVPVHEGEAALFDAYDAVATPYAVVVGGDGRVTSSAPVGSRSALRSLFRQVDASESSTPGGRP